MFTEIKERLEKILIRTKTAAIRSKVDQSDQTSLSASKNILQPDIKTRDMVRRMTKENDDDLILV